MQYILHLFGIWDINMYFYKLLHLFGVLDVHIYLYFLNLITV
jgi:hypothetical protein